MTIATAPGVADGPPRAAAPAPTASRRARTLDALSITALTVVCALGAALRFANFGAVYTTPYYDSAVRSMSLSWHNFFYGALDPSGQVSIDKAPVDLWLQVASTKLLGFSSVSLRLPPAIAGTVAILLLYDLVRRGFGRTAGLAAALAFAVLPTAVLTSRSDTMDSVMGMLLVAAAWLVVRVRPEHRPWAVAGAGVLAGLAFEVKLFEAAVAVPAIVLLAWLALDGTAGRKAAILAGSGAAWLATAASWAVVASLAPGRHPYPLGSSNGQIWNAILVYNGIGRFGHPPTAATAPGLLRLFQAGPPRHFGSLIGVELAAALAFGALALVVAALPGASISPAGDLARRRRAVGWGLGVWLVLGALVASFMGRQWPRYLEAFTPAVAGVLGIGLVWTARGAARCRIAWPALVACAVAAAFAGVIAGHGPDAAMTIAAAAAGAGVVLGVAAATTGGRGRRVLATAAAAAVLLAVLAVPVSTSMELVRRGAGDSAAAGRMGPTVLRHLSRYLRAHRRGARYEVAGASILKTAPLIIKDARPVLTLTGPGGRPLLTPRRLEHRIRAGKVRYALIGKLKCTAQGKGSGCAPVVRWVRAHGRDVSRAAGMPHRGELYRL